MSTSRKLLTAYQLRSENVIIYIENVKKKRRLETNII